MNKLVAAFFLFYVPFSPISSIIVTVLLAKILLAYGMPRLATWCLVLIINVTLFLPIIFGTEGFGWFMPWFYMFHDNSGVIFSKGIAIVAACYLALIDTVAVFYFSRRNKLKN